MDTKTMIICGAALFLAIIDLAFTDDGKLGDSDQAEMKKRMSPDVEYDGFNPYDLSDEDLAEIIKRGSLLRFGKRGSILRFGKRGSLLRFGKRRSLLRYGKRYDDQDENLDMPLDYYGDAGSDDEKRGSLFRFGKRRALFRYGRSAEKPHTPFRFGREEDY